MSPGRFVFRGETRVCLQPGSFCEKVKTFRILHAFYSKIAPEEKSRSMKVKTRFGY